MGLVIAGDIGGTNARFALFDKGSMIFRWSCSSRRYAGFHQALHAFLEKAPEISMAETSISIAVAGVVENYTKARGTNISWTIDCARITSETGCAQCMVINDFEAAAWGATVLDSNEYTEIGSGTIETEGTMAILGAGTGLGQAIIPCIEHGKYMVVPTEGGHTGFAPENREELALLSWLMKRYRHVSIERLLSGHGLVNIYYFLKGESADNLAKGVENDRLAPEITQKALDGSDRTCEKAVDMFCRIYGSEAGNLALKCLPSAGVYVAGGIAPVILPFILKGEFRKAFENKGCMQPLLKKIPVFIVLNTDLGLKGAVVRAEGI